MELTVHPWTGGHITGRYARARRFPTLPEYYWWYSGYQPVGRKTLTAEKANQWELEVGHRVDEWFEIKARVYEYQVEDYIRTIFGYRPSRVVYNIDRVDFQGLELEATGTLPWGFTVWANYTFQQTQKHGDVLDNSSMLANELVELPENQCGAGLDYHHESGLDAGLILRYVGSRYAVRGNQAVPGSCTLQKMGSYVDVDVNLSCPVFRGQQGQECRVFITIQNLRDKHWEEEYGYPMPGRTFMAGIEGKL